MSSLVCALLSALALTLAAELSVAAILGVRGWDLVIIGLVNCLTNPLVNYAYWWAWALWGGVGVVPYLVLAALEISVLFGEAAMFKKLLLYRKIKPLLLSLILNASSFVLGIIIALLGVKF